MGTSERGGEEEHRRSQEVPVEVSAWWQSPPTEGTAGGRNVQNGGKEKGIKTVSRGTEG